MKKECALRLLFLNLSIESPQIFKDFCFKFHYLFDKNPEKINDFLELLNNNEEVKQFFAKADLYYSVSQDWFENAFKKMFSTEDIVYEYSEKLEQYFNSPGAKYLFILQNVLDDFDGLSQKRKLTKKEEALMESLLNNDEEFSENDISEIKNVYNVFDINDLILCYYISKNIGY